MKVSVIVPVYNTEAYLRKCLDSLIYQTLQELEIVLIDDGSTDESGTIMEEYREKYPDKVRVIHKENGGQGIARNIGIQECRGEYIGFMDSDDYVDVHMYETMYNKAVEVNADYAECRYRYVKSIDDREEELATYGNVREHNTLKDMFIDPLVSPWNKLYKKTVLEDSSSWFTEGVIYEDTAFFLKQIPLLSKTVFIEDAFVTHILRGSSTMSINKSKKVGDIFVVLKDILQFYEERGYKEKYKQELEYFCVKILLCSSLERISKVKDKILRKQFLRETNRMMREHFNDYRNNPYMNKGFKSLYMKMIRPWNIDVVCFFLRFVSKV